jgi:hypothetical protein
MKLIESKTLATAAAFIEFTSIPQDGTDIVFLISGRNSGSNVAEAVYLSLNGSATGFTGRYLEGNGASAYSGLLAQYVGSIPGATATSNTFGNIVFYIPNYSGSTNKSYSVDAVTENNATTSYQTLVAGLWSNTSAITSATFTPGGALNFLAGSTISLYKITKGTDGIVVVS